MYNNGEQYFQRHRFQQRYLCDNTFQIWRFRMFLWRRNHSCFKQFELVNSTLGNKTLHTIIEKSNIAEINLYKKMGYTKDPKYRDRTAIKMIRMVSTNQQKDI